MIYTILWLIGFCTGMLLTVPFLCSYYIIRLFASTKIADKFSYVVTRYWAKSIILSTGSTVCVNGLDNLTTEKSVCFIANHQSFFDIPLLMGWLNRPVGFIAKKELKKIPVLSGWITAIYSAFLDRSNPRKAIDSINKGIQSIKSGHAIAIFPEGTRSKDGKIGDFKPGSLKLAIGANAVIQPLSIKSTRDIYETNKRIRGKNITLVVHKAITPSEDIYRDKTGLISVLHNIIDS
jgi:1-acyl-sn-glycerol-3-phosphate acyltransferase